MKRNRQGREKEEEKGAASGRQADRRKRAREGRENRKGRERGKLREKEEERKDDGSLATSDPFPRLSFMSPNPSCLQMLSSRQKREKYARLFCLYIGHYATLCAVNRCRNASGRRGCPFRFTCIADCVWLMTVFLAIKNRKRTPRLVVVSKPCGMFYLSLSLSLSVSCLLFLGLIYCLLSLVFLLSPVFCFFFASFLVHAPLAQRDPGCVAQLSPASPPLAK